MVLFKYQVFIFRVGQFPCQVSILYKGSVCIFAHSLTLLLLQKLSYTKSKWCIPENVAAVVEGFINY